MERKTMREDIMHVSVFGDDGIYFARDLPHIREAINLLAKYEDTGMTPEEIEQEKKAKEDGRMVVLPEGVSAEVIGLIAGERKRQIELWGAQSDNTLYEWIGTLGEEFGELCEAVNETCFRTKRHPDRGGYGNIAIEAIQVAAVAAEIAEAVLAKAEAEA